MSEREDRIIALENELSSLRSQKFDSEESESRYRAIVETTHDAIYIYNQAGFLVYANNAACLLHGMTISELLNTSPKRFLHPNSLNVFLNFIKTLSKGKKFRGLAQGIKKDGSIREIEIYGCPITFNGEIHYYSSVRDITDLKHSQEALEASKEKAEQASRIKDEFLAIMSHEMQTPLNPILGYLSMLESKISEADQLELVQRAWKAAQQLHLIINDILFFSRIDYATDSRHLETCLLSEIATKSLSDCIDHKNNQLSLIPDKTTLGPSEIESSPVIISIEKVYLLKVLNILLSNACKFTRGGHIELAYAFYAKAKAGFNLVFEVKDDGVGIDKEKLDLIFNPFTQADSSYTRDYGGIGLGLSICRRLVDNMNGVVEVESTPNQGSLFRVKLLVDTP